MNIIEKVYIEHTDNLMQKSDHTVFLITGIRFGDYKDNTDAFIQEAAQKRLEVILMPDDANPFDPEAVVCYWGNKQIGFVATYDLEKFHILTRKNDSEHLTGRFFYGDTKNHFLKLSVTGTITSDDIYDYRKEVDKQKEELYGKWEHGAIKCNLVSNRHKNDAKACISQMKDFIIKLWDGYGSSTMDELPRLMNNYKESSRYDLSLEGQRDRWDIMLNLDQQCDAHHKPNALEAKDFEEILADVSSQIGGEMGRIVSYESYIERLTKLVTEQLPSSDPARLRLKALSPQAIDNIRRQVKNFPHDLYNLFCNDPKEFVKTLYYARIPRRYLDPFLSGIALVQAYDKIHSSTESMSLADDSKPFGKDVTNSELKIIYDGLMEHKMLCDKPSLEDFIYWITGRGLKPQAPLKWTQKNVCRYFVQFYLNSDWSTAEQCFLCNRGSIKCLSQANNTTTDNKKIIDKILEQAKHKTINSTTKVD